VELAHELFLLWNSIDINMEHSCRNCRYDVDEEDADAVAAKIFYETSLALTVLSFLGLAYIGQHSPTSVPEFYLTIQPFGGTFKILQ
jgi:hypothetical protein